MSTTALAQSDSLVLAQDGDSWDLETFFDNAAEYAQVAGGAFLTLIGVVCVIWGGFLLAKKLMSDQARENWLKIALLIIVGGALFVGGITIIMKFARGGNETVEKFGNGGTILLHNVADHANNLIQVLPF